MLIARCQPRIRLFKGCVQLYAVVCSCIQLCSVVCSCMQLCACLMQLCSVVFSV